ncbi:MAG: hypothetical protein ACKPDI_09895 [Actinomycetota bacterium]
MHRSIALLAEGSFNDPTNARTVYLAAGGLLLLALALGVGTWLWWRSAKVEHPALGPLEVMSRRQWLLDDFTGRRRRLDEARPDGATPQFVPPDPVDLEAAEADRAERLDDLGDLADPLLKSGPAPVTDGSTD